VPLATAAQKIPPSVGLLEAVDEAACLLRIGSPSLEGFGAFLAWIGFEFEVREPAELVASIRRLAERCLRATKASEE